MQQIILEVFAEMFELFEHVCCIFIIKKYNIWSENNNNTVAFLYVKLIFGVCMISRSLLYTWKQPQNAN